MQHVKQLREEWGRNIRDARVALGKSQRWLARELDVAPSNVNRWERGLVTPRDEHKMRIARVLNIPARLLFPMNGFEEN